MGLAPRSSSRNFRNWLTFFASISFGPYCSRRVVASAWVRPFGDDTRRFSTSARGRVFRSSFVWDFDLGFAP
jgi:hypothetical protein